jgi:hypothetical protein
MVPKEWIGMDLSVDKRTSPVVEKVSYWEYSFFILYLSGTICQIKMEDM